MTEVGEREFYRLRKQGRTYVSRVFSFGSFDTERVRNIKMVLEGSDRLLLGEIEGAMCLRLSGDKRKTQVTALVTQDGQGIRRVTLQAFVDQGGDWIRGVEEHSFTFRADEFERLRAFLSRIEFIDLSNEESFQIDDVSTSAGPKAIIDASDRRLVDQIRNLSGEQRARFLDALQRQQSLSQNEINILLGRRQGLEAFEQHIATGDWDERKWQDFFEREQWVFGYGLDYRIMRQFDREMTVGAGGTDNKNKPAIDYLMTFTDYTVLVEIKRPDTEIFRKTRSGRAGTWEFTSDFTGAVSQLIEQRAEWLAFAESGEHYNRAGTSTLEARTRSPKSILVIGSTDEFGRALNVRDRQIKRDTFELFRRELRTIDILTFDELMGRARFIARSE